ncbi:MAG TPA: hypothetical protein VNE62_01020 [Actinomycetota bacterium]|nr:hypothetical protein [Actinomycetota bacterium]
MKRLLGASASLAVVSAVVVLPAPAAVAVPAITFGADCPEPPTPGPDPTPTPQPDPPPAPVPECTPRTGQVLRGTHNVRFSVDSGGTVARLRRVEVHLIREDVEPPPTSGLAKVFDFPDFSSAPSSGTYTVTWDTDAATPFNGKYTFEVRAENHSPDSTRATRNRKGILVDNFPEVPARPTVVTATTKGVTVEWKPAPEPDFESFTLYRAKGEGPDDPPRSSDYEPILDTKRNSHLDEVKPGSYWYKVQVTRRSVVTPESGISSVLSERSAKAGTVVEPTPAPSLTPTPVPLASATPEPKRGQPVVVRNKKPPVPDAPFSTILPFDNKEFPGPQETDVLVEPEQAAPPPTPEARRRKTALPAAIGVFMVSAWAVLTRSRVFL